MSVEKIPQPRKLTPYVGIFAALVLVVFFGALTYRSIERDLTAAALSGRTSIAYLAAATLSEEFKRLADVGRSLATRVRFRELIAAGQWQAAGDIMSAVSRDFDVVERVFLVDPNGLLKAQLPVVAGAMPTDLANRDWYIGVTRQWKPYISTIFLDPLDSEHLDFALAVPVLNEHKRPIAILVLSARVNRFFDWVQGLRLEPDGSISIVDHAGQRAFESTDVNAHEIVMLSDLPLVKRVLDGDAGVVTEQGDSDHGYVAAFAPVHQGWGVIAKWPQRTVFAARDAQLRRMLLASALILLMTLAAAFLLMRLLVERRRSELDRLVNVQLERHVAERTAQLAQMNVELESFSYSISHDLRAPLRAIDGYSQMLGDEQRAASTENSRRLIGNIHRNVAHMAQLIDELLEFSRLNQVSLQYQAVEMNKMVNVIKTELAAADIHAAINIDGLPSARGDAALLHQVWTNIIDNAVKYSSRSKNARIDITGVRNDREVIYCTADNGAGFDMNYYDRLFKPFSRLHSAGEYAGTGVGLAIVKRIVERHGGRVWAESVPAVGTKMYFSLPSVEEPVSS